MSTTNETKQQTTKPSPYKIEGLYAKYDKLKRRYYARGRQSKPCLMRAKNEQYQRRLPKNNIFVTRYITQKEFGSVTVADITEFIDLSKHRDDFQTEEAINSFWKFIDIINVDNIDSNSDDRIEFVAITPDGFAAYHNINLSTNKLRVKFFIKSPMITSIIDEDELKRDMKKSMDVTKSTARNTEFQIAKRRLQELQKRTTELTEHEFVQIDQITMTMTKELRDFMEKNFISEIQTMAETNKKARHYRVSIDEIKELIKRANRRYKADISKIISEEIPKRLENDQYTSDITLGIDIKLEQVQKNTAQIKIETTTQTIDTIQATAHQTIDTNQTTQPKTATVQTTETKEIQNTEVGIEGRLEKDLKHYAQLLTAKQWRDPGRPSLKLIIR